MFDRGEGPPLVVIPGLQGRWEWALPALQRLARRCRTVSYSLCGDFGSRHVYQPQLGFSNYVRQLDAVLDEAGLERAAICGVSFGGYVALRYAAERPRRVASLVLASAPGPGFRPNAQQARWLMRPWLSTPVFVLTSPLRVWPEIRAALPDWQRRAGFFVRQGVRCAAAPMLPSMMASRMRSAADVDFEADARRVRAATLVVTGEARLDRVVPVESTRKYLSLIPGAQYEVMDGTGHMGLLTRPERFAEIVTGFVHAHDY